MAAATTRTRLVLFYWLPVFCYCLAIFLQSAYPSPEKIPAFPGVDKLLHAGAYAVLGILCFRACLQTAEGRRPLLLMGLSIVFTSLYGISDEVHQHFVPSRHADILDAVADTVGGIVGVIGFRIRFRAQSR